MHSQNHTNHKIVKITIGQPKNQSTQANPSFPYLEIARRIPRPQASKYDGPRSRFTNWKKVGQVQKGLLG